MRPIVGCIAKGKLDCASRKIEKAIRILDANIKHKNRLCHGNFHGAACFVLFFARDMLEIGVDKSVDLTVHDSINVAFLVAGTVVLDKGVGHEYVGADLRAPLDVVLVPLNLLDGIQPLADLDIHELGLQHTESGFLVLELRALGLAGDHNARSLMGDTNS